MKCVNGNCDGDVCEQAEEVGLAYCRNCLDDYYIDREIDLAESMIGEAQ